MKFLKSTIQHPLFQYTVIAAMALTIGLYFRLYPLRAFVTHDSSEKASVMVIGRLKQQIRQQVEIQFPNMADAQKELLAKKQLDQIIKKDRHRLQESINTASQSIDQDTGQSQTPYLLASDSYHFYDLTENIVDTGSIGAAFKGSKYLNAKMMAPQGHWEPITLHPYVGFVIYKTLKLFNPDITLMHAVSYTPILITVLAIIPYLVICYLLGLRLSSTLLGAVFFLLAPVFLKRSMFGWYDNDPYNALFPLCILASAFLGLKYWFRAKRRRGFAILTALLILMYALFWQGWMFVFSILAASFVLNLLATHLVLREKHKTKDILELFGLILIGSFAAITLAFGLKEFFLLFKEGTTALTNFLTPQLSLWPDLYISVSELHRSHWLDMIDLSGGLFFCVIACVGLIGGLKETFRLKESERFSILITCAVFLFASSLITLGAQRFAMLLVIPLSILFAVGMDTITRYLFKRIESIPLHISLVKKFLKAVVLCLLLACAFLPITRSQKTAGKLLNPIYNQTWNKALTAIKKLTPEESIVNAWWPPGHFIKSMADRRVTFDGATINVPQAYWMANVFLTNHEKEALGILRMLNTSGNKASEFLDDLGIKRSVGIPLLKEVTSMDTDDAASFLSVLLKHPKPVGKLLALTHGKPPPTYLLIYNEFVEKNLQLKFIGDWNFKKIEDINNDPAKLKEVPDRNSPEYISFLWDLVGGPLKYSGILRQVAQRGDTVIFDHQLMVNLTSKQVMIHSPEYGSGTPYSIFYIQDNALKETLQKEPTLGYSVILTQKGNVYQAALMERRLATSMLMQLYFFDGIGLKYFKPLVDESDLTGRTRIKVFEVDWDLFESDLRGTMDDGRKSHF